MLNKSKKYYFLKLKLDFILSLYILKIRRNKKEKKETLIVVFSKLFRTKSIK